MMTMMMVMMNTSSECYCFECSDNEIHRPCNTHGRDEYVRLYGCIDETAWGYWRI
jgi:hypothetical protein